MKMFNHAVALGLYGPSDLVRESGVRRTWIESALRSGVIPRPTHLYPKSLKWNEGEFRSILASLSGLDIPPKVIRHKASPSNAPAVAQGETSKPIPPRTQGSKSKPKGKASRGKPGKGSK